MILSIIQFYVKLDLLLSITILLPSLTKKLSSLEIA